MKTLKNACAIVLAYLFLAFVVCFGAGCGLLGAKPARVEHFDCQVRALEPLVGDVLDARDLVAQLYKGQASLQSVLGNLNATTEELVKLQADLQACEPPPPQPGSEEAS